MLLYEGKKPSRLVNLCKYQLDRCTPDNHVTTIFFSCMDYHLFMHGAPLTHLRLAEAQLLSLSVFAKLRVVCLSKGLCYVSFYDFFLRVFKNGKPAKRTPLKHKIIGKKNNVDDC